MIYMICTLSLEVDDGSMEFEEMLLEIDFAKGAQLAGCKNNSQTQGCQMPYFLAPTPQPSLREYTVVSYSWAI